MAVEPCIFRAPITLAKRRYCKQNEVSPEYRTEFMRDRDRLMYATAFRRLAGKTQIYTVGRNDHKKTRLTHTLEVSQIARTIAVALGLDSDLAEAIALGHDFGHTPFGHAGEEMLHQIMSPESDYVKGSPFYQVSEAKLRQKIGKDNSTYADHAFGFKHNIQSVRVAAMLEDSYEDNAHNNIGLDLTNFTLYGMMMHSALDYTKKNPTYFVPNFQQSLKDLMCYEGSDQYAWSLEAYVVKLADDIAQWHHDLEDAIYADALPLEKIRTTISDALGKALKGHDKSSLKKCVTVDRRTITEISHIVVNTLVTDLVTQTSKNIKLLLREAKQSGVTFDAQNLSKFFTNYDDFNFSLKRYEIVSFSTNIAQDVFKNTIRESIHHSLNVERMNIKGQYIISKLFDAYYAHPLQLPDGPILHLMVETGSIYKENRAKKGSTAPPAEPCKNVDEARALGIGIVRIKLDEIYSSDDCSVYFKSVLMRRICDHIASMTDSYAMEEYRKLYG